MTQMYKYVLGSSTTLHHQYDQFVHNCHNQLIIIIAVSLNICARGAILAASMYCHSHIQWCAPMYCHSQSCLHLCIVYWISLFTSAVASAACVLSLIIQCDGVLLCIVQQVSLLCAPVYCSPGFAASCNCGYSVNPRLPSPPHALLSLFRALPHIPLFLILLL